MTRRQAVFLLTPTLCLILAWTLSKQLRTPSPVSVASNNPATISNNLETSNKPVTSNTPVATSNRLATNQYTVRSVWDGDTFYVVGLVERVRVWGIDAPEKSQKCFGKATFWMCGVEATDFLSRQILGRTLDCNIVDIDQYDRNVARCSFMGNDVGEIMVRNGWAVDWPKYSQGFYAKVEETARQDSVGVYGDR